MRKADAAGHRQRWSLRWPLSVDGAGRALAFLLLVTVPAIASGQGGWTRERPQSRIPDPNLKDIGIDQRLDAQAPLDVTLVDESGNSVALGDYFTGKPVVLVLAYYRCPMLCTLVLNSLTETMKKVPLRLGKDYEVVTVSFDPREGPALAMEKKKTYLERLGNPDAGAAWHFLTGSQKSIRRLTEAIGFRYVYDEKEDQFLHPSGITLLTPSGRISRYFFGVDYSPRDLRLGLVEASDSKIGTPTDQVLLYCFHYSPTTGKYTANVLNFVRVGGVVVLVSVGLFSWFLIRRARHHREAVLPEAATAGREGRGSAEERHEERGGGAP